MPVNSDEYEQLTADMGSHHATLVAVSKTKSVSEIKQLYDLGQRDFGENYVQELLEKQGQLPGDIRWHFIGHLQGNKVKQIIPFIHLVQSVDSHKLLQEINKQAQKINRVVDVLLQVHIAQEETKFGMDKDEVNTIITGYSGLSINNTRICGLMGMASLTDDMEKVQKEFEYLRGLFNACAQSLKNFGSGAENSWTILSMGMSSDYPIAIEAGSNMVRIGSLLFGARN